MKLRIVLMFAGSQLTLQAYSQSSSQNVIKDQAVARTVGEMSRAAATGNGVAMIGVFRLKEETEGTEFLYSNWHSGSVTDNYGASYEFQSLNYDKITGEVWFTADSQTIVLDNSKISAFRFDSRGEPALMFRRKDQIAVGVFLKVLVDDSAYSLYDNFHATFHQANYTSDGLTESGDKFDKYADNHSYYVGFPDGKVFLPVKLIRKSLNNLFKNNKTAQRYLEQHKLDPVTESFLKGLVEAMNRSSL